MNKFFTKIRKPTEASLFKKCIATISIFFIGIFFGVISKILDETPSNALPFLLEILDLRNFFSRIGVWIFISIIISFYSISPVRAGINVFSFLGGMVGSYYFYTIYIAGFFPKSYMIIWIVITIFSPLLAFICWYAKGKGFFAMLIASIILMFLARQSFAFGFWYFDISYWLEFILLLVMIIILYKTPKQIILVVTLGLVLFLLTAQINLWGIL